MDSTLSLSTAVTRVTIFLTEKLISSYPDYTLAKLQRALKDNLTTHYAPYWDVQKPIRGSARRSMTLSPMCLPPRPIWSACTTANVQWFDWISLLGNKEFDLFVDPGCIAVRCQNMVYSVWTAEPASSATAVPNFVPATVNSKRTFAQQLIGNDTEEDQLLFQVLADEINSGPVRAAHQIAIPARSTSPFSEHSRCSSRSSNSNSSGASAFSFASDSSHTSLSASTSSSKGDAKQSRREKLRQSRVFVDTTKTEVTPYDGGKTTVLTGGVMLGGGPKATKPKKALSGDNTWRAIRD